MPRKTGDPRRTPKEKKEMEYEQAPSGYVTLYNYKEPFMQFDGGFGFRGVLLFDGSTDTVQCHFCGEWVANLSPHLHREHNMKAKDYKERVGLLQTTCLLSETGRTKLLRNIEIRKKNLAPGKPKTEEVKEKIRKTSRANADKPERQNLYGTCPAQLCERLRKLSHKLGRSPTIRECTFAETVKRVFGSYNEGIRRAGLQARKIGENAEHATFRPSKRYTDEQLLQFLRDFKEQKGRYPHASDFARKFMMVSYGTYSVRFGSWSEAMLQAFPELQEKIREESKKNRVSQEEITLFIR